jgi:hypothetical protein
MNNYKYTKEQLQNMRIITIDEINEITQQKLEFYITTNESVLFDNEEEKYKVYQNNREISLSITIKNEIEIERNYSLEDKISEILEKNGIKEFLKIEYCDFSEEEQLKSVEIGNYLKEQGATDFSMRTSYEPIPHLGSAITQVIHTRLNKILSETYIQI